MSPFYYIGLLPPGTAKSKNGWLGYSIVKVLSALYIAIIERFDYLVAHEAKKGSKWENEAAVRFKHETWRESARQASGCA
jgi:hypothetical protein